MQNLQVIGNMGILTEITLLRSYKMRLRMLFFGLFEIKKAAIMIYDCDDHDVGSWYCAFKKRYVSAASAGFTPSMFGTIRSHSSLTLLGK